MIDFRTLDDETIRDLWNNYTCNNDGWRDYIAKDTKTNKYFLLDMDAGEVINIDQLSDFILFDDLANYYKNGDKIDAKKIDNIKKLIKKGR